MNKKGQLDYPIITFVLIVIGLILAAPIALKVMNSVYTPVSTQLGNISGGVALEPYQHVMNTGINAMDTIVVLLFIFALVLMLITCFFVDAHPAFLILYILISFLTIIFAPQIIQAADKLYDSPQFTTETTQLVFLGWIKDHFAAIIVGVMLISGVVIYGKFSFLRSGRT